MKKGNVIIIPFAIPSRNTLDKMHWSKKQKLQGQYRLFVRQQMSKYKIEKWDEPIRGTLFLQSVKIHIVRDFDNLVGGAKLMIDALVKEQFIYDDTIKMIGAPMIVQFSMKTWEKDLMSKNTFKLHEENTTIIRTEKENKSEQRN